MTDQQLHALAVDYQVEHRVSYAEAVSAVAARRPTEAIVDRIARTQEHGTQRACPTDAQLHDAATRMVKARGVSYAEGLRLAVASFSGDANGAAFSEGQPAPFNQPVVIFRAGTHKTDDGGVERTFTEADLQAIADAYDPQLHEAPLTVGAPAGDQPAYGWVRRLEATGNELLMHAQNVDADFAEMVRSTAFKKRTAAFYPPESPHNPTPGRWYLRHVAYDGAPPPGSKARQPSGATFGEFGGAWPAATFTGGM